MLKRVGLALMLAVMGSALVLAQATHVSTSGTLPSNCRVGDVYYKTGSSAGLYNCTATNTWTLVAAGTVGNNFFAVTGPTTSTKTFTFPNANATVLTTNALVTVAQGGTGAAPASDDQVFVSSSTSAGAWKTISDCNASNNALQYTQSTNTWSCATITGGGGGGVGTVTNTGTLTANKLIVGNGGSDITAKSATDGQIPIGKTSDSTVTLGTITPGTGIAVTNGAASITVAANGDGFWTTVTAASDQDVASNTTPQNDAELFCSMTANKVYVFEAFIIYSSPAGGGTPDFKFNFNGPATLTGQWTTESTYISTTDGSGTAQAGVGLATSNSTGTATTARLVHLMGWGFSTGGGSGSSGLIFQFAQNTSGVNATRRLAGSSLRCKQVST